MTRSSPHRSFQIIQEKFSRTLKTLIRAPACSTTRKFDQTSPAHKENKTHKNSKSKTTTQDKKNEKEYKKIFKQTCEHKIIILSNSSRTLSFHVFTDVS